MYDRVNWATKADYHMEALDFLRAAHQARVGAEHVYADDYGLFEDEPETGMKEASAAGKVRCGAHVCTYAALLPVTIHTVHCLLLTECRITSKYSILVRLTRSYIPLTGCDESSVSLSTVGA